MTKTTIATLADHKVAMNRWRVIDAAGQVRGRLAAKIAEILMGKDRPNYTPHVLMGDGVILINAAQVKVSGNKAEKDEHTYYTGFPGGLRHVKLADHLQDNPVEVMQLAVRRMLPKNRLGAQMMKRLKVYRDGTHPHAAQKPETTKVSTK
ncbi:MAG: hypothetical protein RL148_898 [Planctomycetota bacterium]|jgi:large subunit ribosomal protein L13